MPEIPDPYWAWKSRIRKLEKIDSLRVIWVYHNFNSFWTSIPEDISVPREFYEEWNRWMRFISAFFLISYMRDILAYSWSRQRYTLRDWGQFWFLQNLANQLTAWGIIDDINETRALSLRLFQIAHQQFKWQEIQRDYFHYINSYAYLVSNEDIDNITKEILWIWSKRILEIWFLFFAGSMSSFSMKIDNTLVSDEELKKFLDIFGVKINDLSRKLRAEHNNDFSFEFSWIRELINLPIIIHEEGSYISPMPLLLLRGVFEWIYFKWISKEDVDIKLKEKLKLLFWHWFQELCFKVISSGIKNSSYSFGTDLMLLASYSSDKKPRNPDFYIETEDCLLLLDSKFTSIPEVLVTNPNIIQENWKSKFIDNIKQWFDFVENYRSGLYSSTISQPSLKEYVIFLTPFDTFFTFWVSWFQILDQMLDVLKSTWNSSNYDFIFMWINELHRFMQLGSKYWFREILDMKFSNKFRSYEMLWFMNEIAQNWYDLEYSQYDFDWYDFMSEITEKYKPH